MDLKPNIFIGSSSEGYNVAKLIRDQLASIGECSLWDSVFDLNVSNFDNLASQIAFFDYAILIATNDDILISRKEEFSSARDNVLFEFGLFAGGLGKSKVFFIVEDEVKILSDLAGITILKFSKRTSKFFQRDILSTIDKIKKYMQDHEKTFDLGFLPSTALAYGYFKNFVERTVERLLEDKSDMKKFQLQNGTEFTINKLDFTVLIPDDLADDMFKKVIAKRLRDGWQKMKVDPKHVRDYDFSIDVSKVTEGCLHLVDIPFTLNALNLSIELYSSKSHLGKTVKETILETREIRNFKRTLEYLISGSAICRGIVNVEVVNI